MYKSIPLTLGSESTIKEKALRAALLTCPSITVDPSFVAIQSAVNEQPVGEGEILLGAMHRAREAQRLHPRSWAVGIESGLVSIKDGAAVLCWQDIAAVVLIAPDGTEHISWSAAAKIPTEYVDKARERGFEHYTVGDVIAEALQKDSADDPHKALYGVERATYLMQPLTELLSRHISSSYFAIRPMTLGTLFLPLHPVTPTTKVALFNIRAQHELAQELGEAIVKNHHIPSDAEVIVMPAGKASNVLQVLGNKTGLPCLEATKEDKYLECPISAEYFSITSQRTQTLFIEPHLLKGKKVVVFDDVVSTGSTLKAVQELCEKAGATVVGITCIFTEGERREDVTSLGHLPIFKTEA